jgi:hypothetical protein
MNESTPEAKRTPYAYLEPLPGVLERIVVVVVHARDLVPVLDGEEEGLEVRCRGLVVVGCACGWITLSDGSVQRRMRVCVSVGRPPMMIGAADRSIINNPQSKKRRLSRGNVVRTLNRQPAQVLLLLLRRGGRHQEGCVCVCRVCAWQSSGCLQYGHIRTPVLHVQPDRPPRPTHDTQRPHTAQPGPAVVIPRNQRLAGEERLGRRGEQAHGSWSAVACLCVCGEVLLEFVSRVCIPPPARHMDEAAASSVSPGWVRLGRRSSHPNAHETIQTTPETPSCS